MEPATELTRTLTLAAPIAHAGATIAELQLREPTAGEIARAFDADDPVSVRIAQIAAVSGLPVKAIEQLGARDLLAAGGFLSGFASEVVFAEGQADHRVALKAPLTFGAETIAALDLREPKAGELARSTRAGNGPRGDLWLLAEIVKLPASALDKMGARDFDECRKFFAFFMNAAPATG